ncbi:winged helix-turn-helix transcriptional regulator [Candidatus Bathyarchaeota archaeon]|nr:winged helix-turn-helix transcriptional regulator [Candidatus Bathyarchaeota archaeon]
MSDLKKPSPATMRRIYYALVRKPHSFDNLVKATGVDEATLGAALDFLKDKGMIVSYKVTTKCVMFRMVRTQPLRYGWNFPWLDLMMSMEDWKTPWTQAYKEVEDAEDKLDKRFVKLLKYLLIDPNLDLIEVLEELEMTDVPLETFKLHNQEPYCLECLKKEKRFVRMILCEKSEEHCCPNCGIVRETLLTKRR